MVGLIPDLTKTCTQAWLEVDDLIYLLGLPTNSSPDPKLTLGGSEYLASIHNIVAGRPPQVDFELERRVQQTCRYGIKEDWIRSAHDCAEGGLVVALAECCINSKLGAEVILEIAPDNSVRWDEVLFAEGGARIIVSVPADKQEIWESHLKENLGQNWQQLGKVANSDMGLRILNTEKQILIQVSNDKISNNYYQSIPRRLAFGKTDNIVMPV